jgi:hypothetical protein
MAQVKMAAVGFQEAKTADPGISPVNFVEDPFCVMVLDIEGRNVLKRITSINPRKRT